MKGSQIPQTLFSVIQRVSNDEKFICVSSRQKVIKVEHNFANLL